MRQVTAALSGLLGICVAVRIAAWLIAPAWPIIIVLLALLGLFRLILGRPFRGL
ncbi:MAG: hypothetical protein ACR2NJ_02190 [Acidimicrobiales bacterium]